MLFAKRSGAKNVRRKSLDGADEDVDEGDAGARLPTVSTANQGTIKPATSKPAKVAKLSFDEEATEVSLVTLAAKNLRDALVLLCYYATQDADSAFVVKKKSAVDGIPQACPATGAQSPSFAL